MTAAAREAIARLRDWDGHERGDVIAGDALDALFALPAPDRLALAAALAGSDHVVVPKEPAEKQYEAGESACERECVNGCAVDHVYRAMVSAP